MHAYGVRAYISKTDRILWIYIDLLMNLNLEKVECIFVHLGHLQQGDSAVT